MFGVLWSLKRITGIIGAQIGDQDEGFSASLLLVIHIDVVYFYLGHLPFPFWLMMIRIDLGGL
jgi:hypothetical protein